MEEKIMCPDCGKFLFKATAESRAKIKCWCRRCREEKEIQIPIIKRAKEPNIPR